MTQHQPGSKVKASCRQTAHGIAGLPAALRMQDKLAQKLRVLRRAQGSLAFETFQPQALFQGDRIAEIRQQPQNRARQPIEQLMIATNSGTARFLAEQAAPPVAGWRIPPSAGNAVWKWRTTTAPAGPSSRTAPS